MLDSGEAYGRLSLGMITVQVKLFATLRPYRPGLGIGEAFPVELPDGATVGDLAQELALPENEVKVVFVNALFRELPYVLADGDEVGIFPPVGGG
jgi:molybdopterin converting factor small subunit